MEQQEHSDKELEQLIEIAKQADSKQKSKLQKLRETEDINEAEKFIIFFQIESGKNCVLAKSIYKVYKSWAKSPVSKQKFFAHFSSYFVPQVRKRDDKPYYHYKLNYKAWQLAFKLQQLLEQQNEKE